MRLVVFSVLVLSVYCITDLQNNNIDIDVNSAVQGMLSLGKSLQPESRKVPSVNDLNTVDRPKLLPAMADRLMLPYSNDPAYEERIPVRALETVDPAVNRVKLPSNRLKAFLDLKSGTERNGFSKTRKGQKKLGPQAKISAISGHLSRIINVKTNGKFISVPWHLVRHGDIINWPSSVPIRNPLLISQNGKEINELMRVVNDLDLSPDFISRIGRSESIDTTYPHVPRDVKRSRISAHLGSIISAKTNGVYRYVPWSIMKEGDIINWPASIPMMNLNAFGSEWLNTLYHLLDRLDFSPDFISNLYKEQQRKFMTRDQRQTEISAHLGRLLSDKTNGRQKFVPWSFLQDGDIKNWPSYIPINNLNLLGIETLNYLQKNLEKLDFSPEFISKIYRFLDSGIRALLQSTNSAYHMLGKQSLIYEYLNYLLWQKSGGSHKFFPWDDVRQGDLINWPSSIQFPLRSISVMNPNELDMIIERLPHLDISPTFIAKLNDQSVPRLPKKIINRNYVIETLKKKLNRHLIGKVSYVPWKKLSREDLSGWPENIEFKNPKYLNAAELEIVAKLVDGMEFSPNIVSRVV